MLTADRDEIAHLELRAALSDGAQKLAALAEADGVETTGQLVVLLDHRARHVDLLVECLLNNKCQQGKTCKMRKLVHRIGQQQKEKQPSHLHIVIADLERMDVDAGHVALDELLYVAHGHRVAASVAYRLVGVQNKLNCCCCFCCC